MSLSAYFITMATDHLRLILILLGVLFILLIARFSKCFFKLFSKTIYIIFFSTGNASVLKTAGIILASISYSLLIYIIFLIVLTGATLKAIDVPKELSTHAKGIIEGAFLCFGTFFGFLLGPLFNGKPFSRYSEKVYKLLLAIINDKHIRDDDIKKIIYNEIVTHRSPLTTKASHDRQLKEFAELFINSYLDSSNYNVYLRGAYLTKSNAIRLAWTKLPGDVKYYLNKYQPSTNESKAIDLTNVYSYLDDEIIRNASYEYYLSIKIGDIAKSFENIKLLISTDR